MASIPFYPKLLNQPNNVIAKGSCKQINLGLGWVGLIKYNVILRFFLKNKIIFLKKSFLNYTGQFSFDLI
jgi:hypothetical protein